MPKKRILNQYHTANATKVVVTCTNTPITFTVDKVVWEELLSNYSWYYKNSHGMITTKINGKHVTIPQLLSPNIAKDCVRIYRDGNKLNNCKSNLQVIPKFFLMQRNRLPFSNEALLSFNKKYSMYITYVSNEKGIRVLGSSMERDVAKQIQTVHNKKALKV